MTTIAEMIVEQIRTERLRLERKRELSARAAARYRQRHPARARECARRTHKRHPALHFRIRREAIAWMEIGRTRKLAPDWMKDADGMAIVNKYELANPEFIVNGRRERLFEPFPVW